MVRLEELLVGSEVRGLTPGGVAKVLAVQWYGNAAIEVTYKTADGALGNQLLYREDEARLEPVGASHPAWGFDADADQLRLTNEAYRIHLAHLFDPYLAVHTSAIDPLPHQIAAVYGEMLPRLPLRYLLADDPGAGKTIMTGLLLRELLVRGDLRRCLIVTPGNLTEQWQDELWRKFGLRFELLTNDCVEASVSGNVFTEMPFCIARLDKLARNEALRERLKRVDWDLVVCDEAHKMSASIWGGEVKPTKRFQLGRLLSDTAHNLLLLTATPHNGKEAEFQLFLSLLDPDRFEGAARSSHQAIDASDVMRRLVKEDLLKFDGTPLFPERRATTVAYDLSEAEAALYGAVTAYVREEFNRAENLQGDRKTTVGFALTILQRRLASSPEAIYQSLHRRRERLEQGLEELRMMRRAPEPVPSLPDDYDEDDYSDEELEAAEANVADRATAASTCAEMEAEIRTLKALEEQADAVRASNTDCKWAELAKLLQSEPMAGADGHGEKLIIFTEHRDTLRYLERKIRALLGRDEAVVTIHGALSRDERRKTEERFKQDREVRILIATDAAGEGINLQRAHLMVNYDLPWNPNRLEQRFGRIHRIGQTEVCHLWNLVARETREGIVFQRLFEKLEEERKALGGKVFDILGKLTFENRSLSDLLIEAVRYSERPDVRERLWRKVDAALDTTALRKLLEERALTGDSLGIGQVAAIREEMERQEAHRLQPHFVEAFFKTAFAELGGALHPREAGRYELTFVPSAIRNRDRVIGVGEPVLKRYERVCFDKSRCSVPGCPPADLLCPGHPLLEAIIDLVLERNADILKRGAIFVDDLDDGDAARLLFHVESAIQDGVTVRDGAKRIVSKRVLFVELREDGSTCNAGSAPYLDYRAATAEEQAAIRAWLPAQAWLAQGVEARATAYAIGHVVPDHLAQVRQERLARLDKIERAVKERLQEEINYWDYRAGELMQKERAGKPNAKLNSQQAKQRADDLAARLQKRMTEIDCERHIASLPPAVLGGALVISRGLLDRLMGRQSTATPDADARRAVERAAMEAVMRHEREAGFVPRDVSADKVGYDIESSLPPGREASNVPCLRFIEVKGRAKGAPTVTVTKNEILTALNKPEAFILALVEVDGPDAKLLYLRNPFRNAPDLSAVSVNYDIRDLIQNAEVLFQE
ncbi:MAG TPA: DUF3883 domain-containing protein [Candidatus Spyradenecus faecavium]|uniref:DUF3883 domain-containing protein n=1 Tax=Candidatus Spyradenecus faecavium TaxID=2840947 RepID=A0A9D1T276_9BACT|nr:DUF3883 domain-containing protein [Candidatus Spyradenecus faecavium]